MRILDIADLFCPISCSLEYANRTIQSWVSSYASLNHRHALPLPTPSPAVSGGRFLGLGRGSVAVKTDLVREEGRDEEPHWSDVEISEVSAKDELGLFHCCTLCWMSTDTAFYHQVWKTYSFLSPADLSSVKNKSRQNGEIGLAIPSTLIIKPRWSFKEQVQRMAMAEPEKGLEGACSRVVESFMFFFK